MPGITSSPSPAIFASSTCAARGRSTPSGDRISTSHETDLWAAGQELSDLVRGWWGKTVAVDGVAYRPWTTPETSVNIAFFAHAPLRGRSVRLDRAHRLTDQLVVRYGFTIDF